MSSQLRPGSKSDPPGSTTEGAGPVLDLGQVENGKVRGDHPTVALPTTQRESSAILSSCTADQCCCPVAEVYTARNSYSRAEYLVFCGMVMPDSWQSIVYVVCVGMEVVWNSSRGVEGRMMEEESTVVEDGELRAAENGVNTK